MSPVEPLRPGVAVLGSVNIDLTALVPALPGPGETVTGGVLRRDHGGKGANQATAAARAGARVAFIGAVGEDADGDDVVATLADEGVDIASVRRVDASTGTALICVDDRGENQIAVAPGANRQVTADGVDLSGTAVAVAQLEAPIDAVATFFERARAGGARTVLNAAPIRAGAEQRIIELLGTVDVLVVNRGELAALTGTPADGDAPVEDVALGLLRSSGTGAVVVSLGAGGLTAVTGDATVTRIPAHAVAAVDTVGAGDAMCGAMAAAIADGGSLDDALPRGNAAGALATMAPGARSSPTAAEIDRLLRPPGGP